MSIYGEGSVRSPHFLSAQMSLIELWRTYPRIWSRSRSRLS